MKGSETRNIMKEFFNTMDKFCIVKRKNLHKIQENFQKGFPPRILRTPAMKTN